MYKPRAQVPCRPGALEALKHLVALTRLGLAQCHLLELPPFISNLTALRDLVRLPPSC